MAKTGRPAKPTALKVLHGESRPSRLNAHEPQPPTTPLEPPPGLSDDARSVWDYYCQQVGAMRLLTSADRDALAVLCNAVVMERRASLILSQSSVIIRGQRGNMVRNPAVQVWRDAAAVVKAMCGEFGLTPSARASWAGPGKRDDDDLGVARLLSS